MQAPYYLCGIRHDVVTEFLVPMRAQGLSDIDVLEVERTLARWVSNGKTATAWGKNTIRRVTQGLLSPLRDFGVLQGAVNKRIAGVPASRGVRSRCVLLEAAPAFRG